jgi:hypothetical protein
MKPSNVVVRLSLLVGLLALLAAGAGLFWPAPGSPFTVTTVRGEEVTLYGRGLYRYDTSFAAPILRGTDAVTLLVAVPLLLAAVAAYRRASLRGALLLSGLLVYFLYNAASLALGVMYNEMILGYIFYFSAAFFAFILAFTSIDLQELAQRASPGVPRRSLAVFLFFLAGLATFIWLGEIVAGLLQGRPPEHLAVYNTEPTFLIDLAIIAPAAVLAGVLIWRRAPLGFLLAPILLTLNALVGVMVVAQSIFQMAAGIALTIQEFAVFVTPFVLMSLVAFWFLLRLLQNIEDKSAGSQPASSSLTTAYRRGV